MNAGADAAMEKAVQQDEIPWLERAREVVARIELNDEAAARSLVDELAHVREMELFREIGKLTRDLHEALNAFRLDGRLSELASREIPDAKERLNHVIVLTERAANRTLTAVETGLPQAEALGTEARRLRDQWQRFRARAMAADEFRGLARGVDEFLGRVDTDTEALRSQLSEILMAQDFQDLTGQVIRRVIDLVHDVEESLIGLLRVSGGRLTETGPAPRETETHGGAGPVVPGVEHGEVVNGQDDVDDLLSSLGF